MENLQDKPIQIMTDKGSWQFTDEQIIKIKNKDIEAMTKFYYDNFKLLSAMARKYARKMYYIGCGYLYEYEDLIQQVFLDLPYYDFSNRFKLWTCIVKGSFSRINYGGITAPRSKYVSPLKTKLVIDNNKDFYLGKVASYMDNYNEAEEKEERKQKDKAIELFLISSIKNPIELNFMWCRLFTDLPINEIRGNEYEQIIQCTN